MTNYRRLPKNTLIRIVKEMKKGISKHCLDCVGRDTRHKCETVDCGVYKFRPWVKEPAI